MVVTASPSTVSPALSGRLIYAGARYSTGSTPNDRKTPAMYSNAFASSSLPDSRTHCAIAAVSAISLSDETALTISCSVSGRAATDTVFLLIDLSVPVTLVLPASTCASLRTDSPLPRGHTGIPYNRQHAIGHPSRVTPSREAELPVRHARACRQRLHARSQRGPHRPRRPGHPAQEPPGPHRSCRRSHRRPSPHPA